MYKISEKILLTIWVGGMWAIGYIVAPVLFQMLDKQVAGNVAAQLFSIMSYVGIFSAIALMINIVVQRGFHFRHWQLMTILAMLILVIVGQYILQPMMAELKTAGLTELNRSEFARLHGIASVLFLTNSLAGLVLVVTGLGKKTDSDSALNFR